jgi:hypothetical protein
MNFVLDSIISVFPSALLFFSGYSLSLVLRKKCTFDMIDGYLLSLVFGTALLVVCDIVWVVAIDSLMPQFFVILTLALVCLIVACLLKYRTDFIKDIREVVKAASGLSGSILGKLTILSIFLSLIRTFYYLSIVPINVDALYFYLPSALTFLKLGHVFPYADAPVAPFLYSWSYPSTGGLIIEPFRAIPLLFIFSAPILVYAITRLFVSKRYAAISLILFSFSPFLETGTYLWAWQTDFIAGFFAALSVYLLIKPFRFHEAFAGLSLSLSILTKVPFGLPAAFIVLTIYLTRSKRKLISVFFFTAIVLTTLFFGFKYSFSLIAFCSNIYMALLVAAAVIALLFFSFLRTKPIPNNEYWRLSFLKDRLTQNVGPCLFLLFLLPVVIWACREVMLGGSPFALPIFPTHAPDVTWWTAFKSQITPASNSPWPIEGILTVFLHPLLGLTLLPFIIIGIFVALKQRRMGILLLSFLLYWFIWFSALSRGAGYRHLYPILFFIYPLSAIGFLSVTKFFKIHNSKKEILLLIILVLFEFSQSISVYFSYVDLNPGVLKQLLSFLINKPYLDFTNPIQNSLLVPLLCYGIILCLFVPFAFQKMRYTFKVNVHFSKRLQKIITFLILTVFLSTLLFVPLNSRVISATDGDPSFYSVVGSWYKSEILDAYDIGKIVHGGSILTFGFDAFYYLALNNITYIDLLYGHITSFPPQGLSCYSPIHEAVTSTNISAIASGLSKLNIKYVLIPTSVAWAYPAFQNFNQVSSMFTILIESGSMNLVNSYSDFELFEIDFNKTFSLKQVISENFTQSLKNWTCVSGAWEIDKDVLYGNYSSFGVAVTGDRNLTDVLLEGDVMGKTDVRETGLIFRYQDADNYYRVFIAGKQLRIMKMINGTPTYPENWFKYRSTIPDTWYSLKVFAVGDTFKVYLDGVFELEVTDSQPLLSGRIGVGGYDEFSCFDNVTVDQIFFRNPLG